MAGALAGALRAQGPIDGGFENGGTGWTITDASIVDAGTGAYQGTHALAIDPGAASEQRHGSIAAMFPTTSGQEYRVVFEYQAGFATGQPRLAVCIGGSGPQHVAAATYFFDPGVTRSAPVRSGWVEQSVSFFAEKSATFVQLGPFSRWSTDVGWGRIWIDGVRVEPLGRQESVSRDRALRAILPSVATAGEEVRLTVTSAGHLHSGNSGGIYDTRPLPFSGTFDLACDDPAATFPAQVSLASEPVKVVAVRLGTPGVQRFHLRIGSFEVLSNPVYVSAAPLAKRPYWGDLHIHTELGHSDWMGGTGAQNYAVARDFSALDFAALTEHYGANAAGWMERLVPSTQNFDQPGRFVTFLAVEHYTYQGHHDYFLRGDDPFAMFDGRNFFPSREDILANMGTRNPRFLAIPHHFMLLDPVDWRETDSTALRLAEIYSFHGCSEEAGHWWHLPDHVSNDYSDTKGTKGHDLRTALQRGHKLGLVAASDSHSMQPGFGGLTCVMATALTRAAVFDALYRRECYATTGARILLDFRIASARMGQTLFLAPGTPLEAELEVHGTDAIDAIELVRDGQVFTTVYPAALDAKLTVPVGRFDGARSWVYARVRQHDQQRAWSSPIWIEPTGQPDLALELRDLGFDRASGTLHVSAENRGEQRADALLRIYSSATEPAFTGEGWLAYYTQPTLIVRVEPVNAHQARLKCVLFTPTSFNRTFVFSGELRVWNANGYRVVADPRQMLGDDHAGTLSWNDLFGFHYRDRESKAGQVSDFEILVDTQSATTIDLLPRIDGAALDQVRVGGRSYLAPLLVSVPLGAIAATPPLAEVSVSLAARIGRARVSFPGLPPDATYVAVLDPENLVAESDEDDNAAALLVPLVPTPYDHWSDLLPLTIAGGPTASGGSGAPAPQGDASDPCGLPAPTSNELPLDDGCEGGR